ncbi:MAG: DUF2185 domain-containing protein [Bacteroidales bacterium]|jgi:hypothetical protein|nr:DUF2185 domain-containing protein [Bacteroidales bacterium]
MGLFGSRNNDRIGVKNLELRSFTGEVFGGKLASLPQFAIDDKGIDFLLADGDVLVTQGLSNYDMRTFGPSKYYELAVRVPFNWDYSSSDQHEMWIVDMLHSIIKGALNGEQTISEKYLKIFDQPFHYTSYLNSVALCRIAGKKLATGKEVSFMMAVPLYESELVDNHYLEPSFDLKGLAWQRASLARGNEYFETLDDYYPYECTTDTQAMEEYEAVKHETLPNWNSDQIGCRVSSGVLDYNNKVGYMYRAEPEGDFSGWYFIESESEFAKGTSDNLPLDFYANLDSDLYTMAFQHPEIVEMLHKRPGKAYMLAENGRYEEVTEY